MVLKQQQSITNKAKIHEYMESTFDYREQQISVTLTSASQIFEEYPRYVDFENGSLVIHTVKLRNFFTIIYFLLDIARFLSKI